MGTQTPTPTPTPEKKDCTETTNTNTRSAFRSLQHDTTSPSIPPYESPHDGGSDRDRIMSRPATVTATARDSNDNNNNNKNKNNNPYALPLPVVSGSMQSSLAAQQNFQMSMDPCHPMAMWYHRHYAQPGSAAHIVGAQPWWGDMLRA